ncbi:MAG: hypothetical protein K8R48_07595 [Alphaproteobacteria bacterium]|nr:hypothetical protein [Alphaproteobacteria bacterium]
MSITFKRACWVIAVAGALLVILSLALNLNFFKKQIEAAATKILQQPVHIKGDIKFSMLGWRPAVVLNDVVVMSNGDRPPVIKADRLAVSLMILESPQSFFARIHGLTYEDHLLGSYDAPIHVYATGFDSHALAGELEGATLTGEVSYLENKFHLKLDLKDLPYTRIAEGAEGKIKGKIQLDGRGRDMAQIVHTLKGNFTLIGGAGKLTSRAVNSWTRGLLSTILPGRKTETKLHCMVADFRIDNGIALSRAIIIDTDEVSIFGKGSIDLNRQYVDLILSPKPKSMSIVSLTTPVHMRGPIDNVAVSPVDRAAAKKIGGLLLSFVNPAMALLPLIELGSGEIDSPCIKSLQQYSRSGG